MIDVLIAGAGPVGLALANDLLRWGVSFRIVDQKEGPEQNSKAGNLWPRSGEALAPSGILQRLLSQAIRYDTLMVYAYGKRLGAQEIDNFPSPYPESLQIGQNRIEETMAAHLSERGASVGWQTEVVGVTQQPEHVSVELKQADGQAEVVEARYVVGCDGSRSVVCEAVGLGFERQVMPDRSLWQIDARLRWSRSTRPNQMWFFLFDTGYMTVIPLPGGYTRVWVFREEGYLPAREATLEEMQQAVRLIADDPTAELSDAIWYSYIGTLRTGIAPAFQQGRVLLAGDAGHMSLPIGGQGMNTGLQDAFNLSWKLAAVLQQRAQPVVLDSYATERHAVRQDLMKDQVSGFFSMTHPGWWQRQLVPLVGPLLMRSNLPGGPELAGRRDAAMLDINYPDSPLTAEHLKGGSVKAGDRAPDALVVVANALRTINLFEWLYNGRWTLLLFTGEQTASAMPATVLDAVRPYPFIQSVVLLGQPSAVPPPFEADHWAIDADGFAHLAYDIQQPSLLLVRPDGHVALRCSPEQPDELSQYLARVLIAPAAQATKERSNPSDEAARHR